MIRKTGATFTVHSITMSRNDLVDEICSHFSGCLDNVTHALLQVEEKVKEAAEISMGSEISEEDIINIKHLCRQVVEIQVSYLHLIRT